MDPNSTDPYEKRRALPSGVKTAAFVVILGAVALMADHAFFIAPHRRRRQRSRRSAAASDPAASEGFARARSPAHATPRRGAARCATF